LNNTEKRGPGSSALLRGALAGLLLLGLLGQGGAWAAAAEGPEMTGGGSSSPRLLVPVGRAVGIKLFSDGVMVVGFSQIPAAGGQAVPAKTCGLREGDVITHINASEVDTIEEVQAELAKVGGEEMSIRALREGKPLQVTAQAVKCSTDGSYKLGAWLRDSMAGIGTVTYYDPATGEFGALGHGINDVDTALLMPLETGGILSATVTDVKKGQRGEPGELHGDFDLSADIGSLWANTPHGVYGSLFQKDLVRMDPLEVATMDQVETGEALIYSNIAGEEVRSYTVEITKLHPDASDGRDLTVKVTDPALLKVTGGIVQGMSGSPIVQNGRLVGAVTHVLVGDPTQGYGILAENMLKTAESCQKGQNNGNSQIVSND
jgi:stage IV sporulation protein B